MRRRIPLALATIVFLALAGADDLWARGFGGFHGVPHMGGMPTIWRMWWSRYDQDDPG